MQRFSNTSFGRTLLSSNFGGLLLQQTFCWHFAAFPSKPLPSLPFFVGGRGNFCSLRGFPCLLVFSSLPFFWFRGSAGMKNPYLFKGFPSCSPTKTRRGRIEHHLPNPKTEVARKVQSDSKVTFSIQKVACRLLLGLLGGWPRKSLLVTFDPQLC